MKREVMSPSPVLPVPAVGCLGFVLVDGAIEGFGGDAINWNHFIVVLLISGTVLFMIG